MNKTCLGLPGGGLRVGGWCVGLRCCFLTRVLLVLRGSLHPGPSPYLPPDLRVVHKGDKCPTKHFLIILCFISTETFLIAET